VSRDQGAATGQMPYDPTRCTCTHLSTLHTLPEPGRRGPCSASTCGCRRFEEAAAVPDEQRCPNCAPGYDCERGIHTPVGGD
jgi:hypothetical protein